MTSDRALIRRPSPRLAEGLITHIERVPVDVELAARQWQQYVDALAEAGWTCVEVPPVDDCPDGVFVEDTMVVFRDLAVIARAGANERRPEAAEAERAVAAQGYRIANITEPGTLDGGDILKIGSTVYAGLGGRTNQDGIDQLRGFLEPLGAQVIAVPVSKVLHLKSAVTALPDGTLIGDPDQVDLPGLLVPEEEAGAHVVVLGEDRVLLAASAPQTAAMLEKRGFFVTKVDISEYEKLEGCVTCLSVLVAD